MGHVTRVRIDDDVYHIYPEHLEITRVDSVTLGHDTTRFASRHLFNEVMGLIIGAGDVL